MSLVKVTKNTIPGKYINDLADSVSFLWARASVLKIVIKIV